MHFPEGAYDYVAKDGIHHIDSCSEAHRNDWSFGFQVSAFYILEDVDLFHFERGFHANSGKSLPGGGVDHWKRNVEQRSWLIDQRRQIK